jgi:hypothetical protein
MRITGEQIRKLQIEKNGVIQPGFSDVQNMRFNAQGRILEIELLGEDATIYQTQHDGWSMSFATYVTDLRGIEFYLQLIEDLKSGRNLTINLICPVSIDGVTIDLIFEQVAMVLQRFDAPGRNQPIQVEWDARASYLRVAR